MSTAKANGVSGSELKAGNWGGWAWLGVSLIWIVLDQWTKWWAVTALGYLQPVPVVPGLNWTLVHNHGGAFSLLADHPGWQRWFFLIVASGITVVLLVWLKRTPRQLWTLCLPLALLIGGAIGNLIDRVRLGYVIDFIDVYYQRWHWPAFNIADSGITIGVIALLLYEFFGPKDGADKEAGHGSRTG